MRDRQNTIEQPTPPRPPVAVKGSGDGLRIAVSQAEPEAIETSLRQQLDRRAGAFFEGAPVVLEMPAGDLDLALAARLNDVIVAAGMRLQGVTSRTDEPGRPHRPEAAVAPASAVQASPDAALIVHRTLRSGQRIVHDGPVVVIGDINPGAEILAGGSVIVWGRLRGTVEAGLAEEGDAVVCALDLAPTQLRIGAAIARAPEEPGRTPVPEVASEIDGRIVVDVWDAAGR